VVIGSSPPLAYCTIFIIISSEGVGVAGLRLSFRLVSPVCYRLTVSHVTAAVFNRWTRLLVTSQIRRVE